MLREKIAYQKGLPVQVVTADIIEYPIHFHDDMEVVYVLDGRVLLRNGPYTYDLREGDVSVLNGRDMHSLESTGKSNMVMMLHLDMEYFSRYYEGLSDSFFIVDSSENRDEDIEILRNIMAKIMMEVLQKGYGYEHKVIESTHNLLACLISDFQYDVESEGSRNSKVLAGRLNRIMGCMYDNYKRKLTLSEIAEGEGLSIYYLSHIIKEATGLSFQDMLSYIRVEESERLLLGSNKKVGAIAEEVGFSAVRYYIKHFENWFGLHPLEYRKKYAGKTVQRDSGARYNRCSPMEIEEAIRRQVKGVYEDYVDKLKAKSVILEVGVKPEMLNALDGKSEQLKPEGGIFDIMKRDVNAVLAEPYLRLMELGERIVTAGDNYLITTGSDPQERWDSLSILLYNFDENVGRSLRRIHTENDLLRIIRHYDQEMEFLVKCDGMAGKFRILRCSMNRDNLMKRLDDMLDPQGLTGMRERLVNRLAAAPRVTTGIATSSDVLSIRTTFKGIGMELIMVDKIRL